MKRIHIFLLLQFAAFCSCGQSENKQVNSSSTPAETKAGDQLPPPYATESAVKMSKVIGWDAGMKPTAPKGFTVTRFADSLEHPRWIYQLPNGDVLIAETQKKENIAKKVVNTVSGKSKSHGESDMENRILLFRDSDKNGTYETKTIFIDNLNMPFGMVLVNDYFYVACSDAVWRYRYKNNEKQISEEGEKIMDLPDAGRHWTRNIIANSAGTKLYVAVGCASDHAENGMEKEDRRACILEINPNGSGERVFASGLRNPVGMDWMPGTETLWTAVNERDELGDDLPPDYITSVKENGFYGWPYSYFGQNKDPRIKEKDQRNDLVQKAIVPDVAVGAHTASLGLAFYDKKLFPKKFQGGAFVGQHGSWNRSVLSGYKVVFVPFTNGKPGKPEDFLTGFIANEKEAEVFGRPVGVTVLNDGSMLVADDAANIIWKITYAK
ncbi:MAG TPA: sorbosone dehydrogenase family protein [Flavobacteriales bacterium]|nr:sorbosone dehydrogenase family protein [Flavobacteriales bacterium]